jgi:hypothetical protein
LLGFLIAFKVYRKKSDAGITVISVLEEMAGHCQSRSFKVAITISDTTL